MVLLTLRSWQLLFGGVTQRSRSSISDLCRDSLTGYILWALLWRPSPLSVLPLLLHEPHYVFFRVIRNAGRNQAPCHKEEIFWIFTSGGYGSFCWNPSSLHGDTTAVSRIRIIMTVVTYFEIETIIAICCLYLRLNNNYDTHITAHYVGKDKEQKTLFKRGRLSFPQSFRRIFC